MGAKIEKLNSDGEPGLSNANAHIYYCLIDARECAAKCLCLIEGQPVVQSGSHIRQAAEHYDDIAERLNGGLSNIAWSWSSSAARSGRAQCAKLKPVR